MWQTVCPNGPAMVKAAPETGRIMTVTIYISDTIRSVAGDLPQKIEVPASGKKSTRQLAKSVGVPTALIAFSMVNGVRCGLDDSVPDGSEIHLLGTIAGG